MGTNYYAQIPAKKRCECGMSHDCTEEIHIGKSSYGWKFLFQYNGGRYYDDVDGLKSWLKDRAIVDEYGQTVSHDEFWKKVKDKQVNYVQEDDHAIDISGYRFLDVEFS